MKRFRIGLITTYKMDSVLTKTFLVLIVMSLLMMAMVYYFALDLISDNLRDRTYASNMDMLSKTSNALDLTFSSVGQVMNEVLWDTNVAGVVISPSLSPYTRKVSVVKRLNNLVRNNEYISAAYLYVPKVDTLYTSQGNIQNLSNFNDNAIINNYYESVGESSEIVTGRFTVTVKAVNGRIFLFQEFPTPEKNATLIVELNVTALYNAVNSPKNNADKSIYVFSELRDPVFKNQMDYLPVSTIPKSDIQAISGDNLLTASEIDLSSAEENTYLSYKSSTTGWILVYPFDSRAVQLNFKTAIAVTLPFLAVFLIVSLLFSLYIAYSVYKPIHELMSTVTGSLKKIKKPVEKRDIKNEFDFLRNVFTDAVDQTGHLTELMESVRPTVKEKFLRSLLFDKEISDANIKENLEILGNPASINNRYMVLITVLNTESSKISTNMEINLFNISIGKIVSSLCQEICECDSVITDNGQQIFILGFQQEIPVIQIKRSLVEIYAGMEAKLANLPYGVVIGRGKICNSIRDIKYSYADAKENLNYRIYLGEEVAPDMTEDNEAETLDTQYDSLYFNGRYKQVIEALNEANIEKAAATVERTIKEVAENVRELEAARRLFESLIDTLTEKMVSMRISQEDMSFTEKKYMEREFESFEDIAEMQEFTQNFCYQSIQVIDAYNRKSSNKYIERAKEFVANNYADSSLSLSMVGEHIGINHTYLSRLFYENLDQRFVDYINQYRVDKAKQLLDITNLTIKEVGFKTGFNSIQNFIRVFKKHTGFTPGQYRDNRHR